MEHIKVRVFKRSHPLVSIQTCTSPLNGQRISKRMLTDSDLMVGLTKTFGN